MDENVVVPEQTVIRIYTNNDDAVVICQGEESCEDDAKFVYIHRCHLPAVIKKLQSYVDCED